MTDTSLTPEQMKRIEARLLQKFRKAVAMNAPGDGTPVWKNLLFMLDLVGQGDFYGIVEIKILGCVIKDLRIRERTFKVNEMFRDIVAPP